MTRFAVAGKCGVFANIGLMLESALEILSPSNANDALVAAHSHEAIAAQQRTGLGGETQTGAVSASPSSVPVQAKEALAAPPTLYDALAIRPVESGQAVKAATPANIKQAMIDHATDFGEPDAVHERGDRERG